MARPESSADMRHVRIARKTEDLRCANKRGRANWRPLNRKCLGIRSLRLAAGRRAPFGRRQNSAQKTQTHSIRNFGISAG